MKTAFRVVLGTLLTLLAWTISFFVSGSVLVSSVWPRAFRMQHPDFIVDASKTLVVIPCVIALGVIFARLFRAHQLLWSLAATTLALLIESLATMFPPGSPTLVELPFLLGPVVVAMLINRLRASP